MYTVKDSKWAWGGNVGWARPNENDFACEYKCVLLDKDDDLTDMELTKRTKEMYSTILGNMDSNNLKEEYYHMLSLSVF